MANSILYFAYDASLDPDRIVSVAPGARFRFIAHYPETRLAFAAPEPGSSQPRATLVRDPAHTVWGGVFEVPSEEVPELVGALGEGRDTRFDHRAVDREGNKYDCLTFVSTQEASDDERPDQEYVESMIRGARHWNLPVGWVMGLEDLSEHPILG